MPHLLRLHPESIQHKPKGTQAIEVTPDPRVAPNGFMMLIKGNATKGMTNASDKA